MLFILFGSALPLTSRVASNRSSAYECLVRGRRCHLLKAERGEKKRTVPNYGRVHPGLQPFCHYDEKTNECWVSTGKPEGKGPLGKSLSRWQDNIKTNPEVGWEGKHRTHPTHDRDKGPVLGNTKLRVPHHAGTWYDEKLSASEEEFRSSLVQ